MEETIKKYKQQISHKVDEILSLKSHIGSISDTLSGKFNEAKHESALLVMFDISSTHVSTSAVFRSFVRE
jgi:hypothetical protein